MSQSNEVKPITSPEAHYLKSAGKTIDVKVTIKIVDHSPIIYIRDFEFLTFNRALQFLRHIVETELVNSVNTDRNEAVL